MNTNSPIKFAVIQAGYCVFGAGATPDEAINDATEWLDGNPSPEAIRAQLTPRPNYGDLTLIDSDHPEFASYLSNQGGYVETNGEWYVA